MQEVSEITHGLKALAKELSVPVIALSQLSRQVENREDKRPQLSDLRESGSIEQDADVRHVRLPRELLPGPRRAARGHRRAPQVAGGDGPVCATRPRSIIGKQRHGPIGTVKLSFNEDTTKFGNLAQPGRYEPH